MPAATDPLQLKLLKETAANDFAVWMKEKYTLPRKEGQTRGAAPIQDGMNPKTWIPKQLDYIIQNGKISDEFASEIAAFQEHVKYKEITNEDVMEQLEKDMDPVKFKEFAAALEAAKAGALKRKISKKD
jgi:hypothetical protein